MSRTVRFGLLGSGVIARFHARAIAKIPEAQLVGVCGSSEERAQAFAQEMGIPVYATAEEMAQSSQVDAVCICTPSGLQAGPSAPFRPPPPVTPVTPGTSPSTGMGAA